MKQLETDKASQSGFSEPGNAAKLELLKCPQNFSETLQAKIIRRAEAAIGETVRQSLSEDLVRFGSKLSRPLIIPDEHFFLQNPLGSLRFWHELESRVSHEKSCTR